MNCNIVSRRRDMYSLSHDRERRSGESGEGKRGERGEGGRERERERLLVRENVMELHTHHQSMFCAN